ncbi:hypothetical protein JCM10213v2_008004 [Rhodosporidiobolus nylandii]
MGFDPSEAHRAALKFNSNIEAAANWVMNGAPASPVSGGGWLPEVNTDDIPPLVSADAQDEFELPHPSTVGRGDPPPYEASQAMMEGEGVEKKLPAPFVEKQNSIIDLTGDDTAPPSIRGYLPAPPSSPTLRLSGANAGGDADLARALEASKKSANDEDDDFSKAMALSMASIGSAEEEGVGAVAEIKPEDRVREDMTAPPILRALSPLQSGLSSYLSCLFALPSWRHAVLSWRTPDRARLSGDDYKDYWRGDGGAGLGMPLPVGDAEARENRLIALQRLFALMTLTRRSFLHITEVARAFELRESDFSQHGSDGWVHKLYELYNQLVEDLRIEAGLEASRMLQEGKTQEEAAAFEKKAERRFEVKGRLVRIDEHIAAPLAPPKPNEHEGGSIIVLSFAVTSPPSDIYAALDEQLVTRRGPLSSPETNLHLMTNSPSTLVLQLQRHAPSVTSLDSFGSGAGKQERKVFRPHPGGQDELLLDRYHVKNRALIAAARADAEKLAQEQAELRKQRDAVGRTKEGGDAREMVSATVELLKKEEEREDGEKDEERRMRQRSLRESWERVKGELDGVMESYDTSLTALDTRIANLFACSSSEEADNKWTRTGPYRLTAILMRNGLNGRGSAWSVTRDAEGRWWKISDLVKEEITLDSALDDPSGLLMNAGATLLFYQNTGDDDEPVAVPPHLERIAHLDNHALLSSLPPSHSHLATSWSLPPLDSLAPPPEEPVVPLIPISLVAGAADDDSETVRDIQLDDLGNTPSPSPPPVDVMVDQAAAEKEGEGAGAATPMSVDGAAESEEPVEVDNEGATLRLRGGASVVEEEEEEGEDDEEDYDDEIDEDEVELGLLAPMPEGEGAWDVDFAVGKVGGLPVWLDPRSALTPEDVACGVCGRAMGMLLQVNSPDDSRPHAAARSLYVFACRGKDCLSRGGAEQAVRVWRTQMESPNAFYPHTEETARLRKECEEKLDKETQLASKPEKRLEPFPEFDVQAEPEPYEESYLPDPAAPAAEKEEGTEDAAEPDTKTGVDNAFLIFQERIEREPKQVLRFYRIPGVEDPQPLWASAQKIRPEEVSTCELCRGERKIEFQILSTLLPSLQDDNLDFDSLLVYTCLNHCEIPKRSSGKTGWAAEVVFKQDFAAEGVKFGMGQLRRDLPQ